MNPFLLMYVVLALLMGMRLIRAYFGNEYVCPTCGARSKDRHSGDCPWNRAR